MTSLKKMVEREVLVCDECGAEHEMVKKDPACKECGCQHQHNMPTTARCVMCNKVLCADKCAVFVDIGVNDYYLDGFPWKRAYCKECGAKAVEFKERFRALMSKQKEEREALKKEFEGFFPNRDRVDG